MTKKRLAALLLIFMMLLSASGCGLLEKDDAKCEKVLTSAFDALKAADYETAFSYIYGAEADTFDAKELNAGLLKALCGGFTYKIDSITLSEDKNTATAAVSFTNTDAQAVLTAAYAKITELSMNADFLAKDDALQTADIEAVFAEALQSGKDTSVTLAVEISMAKNGKDWQIKTDEAGLVALLNAVLGGFYDATESLF